MKETPCRVSLAMGIRALLPYCNKVGFSDATSRITCASRSSNCANASVTESVRLASRKSSPVNAVDQVVAKTF